MSTRNSQQPPYILEVNGVHLSLADAKVKVGEAVAHAIRDRPLKAFGHKGMISGVCSGERVPGYLARIYQDPGARRRLALALLRGDPSVQVRVVIEVADDVALDI